MQDRAVRANASGIDIYISILIHRVNNTNGEKTFSDVITESTGNSSSPLISPLYFFFFSSLRTLFLRYVCVKDVNIRGRTRTRHLSFPRFYSRRLILNRGSQGRLRNPARHCEDANQFSSRGSFSRSFHRAGTKRKGGKKEGTDPRATCVRIERMCTQICDHCRIAIPPSPFLPLYLLSIFFPISNLYLSLIGDAQNYTIFLRK